MMRSIAKALEGARKKGLVKIIRHENGEPVYAITKKGVRFVEKELPRRG